jgi:hypothetical protein
VILPLPLGLAAASQATQTQAAPATPSAQAPAPGFRPYSFHFDWQLDRAKIAPQPLVENGAGAMLVVEVEVDGHRLPAILDTGAPFSLIDTAAAREIGLVFGETIDVRAVNGGVTEGKSAKFGQARIGGLTLRSGSLAAVDMTQARAALGNAFAMVIGADVLSNVAILVDRGHRLIVLLPRGAKPPASGTAAPLALRGKGNRYVTVVEMLGQRLTMQIDTGSDDELRIRDTRWAAIAPRSGPETDLLANGIAGPYIERVSRADSVVLGGQALGDAIIHVSGSGLDEGVDGTIGMGLLGRYSLFLDPGAGVFKLDAPPAEQPRRRETMAGIQGLPADDGLLIGHVMAHSPAEEAGLRAGDRICTVDGARVRAAWVGTPDNDWMLGPEGKRVTLGRCGGGTVTLVLRRFY